jgi:hypothetical protein
MRTQSSHCGCAGGREWIAPATVTYLLNRLATGYGEDGNATFILDNFDVVRHLRVHLADAY